MKTFFNQQRRNVAKKLGTTDLIGLGQVRLCQNKAIYYVEAQNLWHLLECPMLANPCSSRKDLTSYINNAKTIELRQNTMWKHDTSHHLLLTLLLEKCQVTGLFCNFYRKGKALIFFCYIRTPVASEQIARAIFDSMHDSCSLLCISIKYSQEKQALLRYCSQQYKEYTLFPIHF